MILSTAIVFNLIGLGWTLSTIGKSFLYVKEKVAQDVGVVHLSQLPFVLFHFIQNGGLRITGGLNPIRKHWVLAMLPLTTTLMLSRIKTNQIYKTL
jgi:hypothetical protein